MILENTVALIGGDLLNTPNISSFSDVCIDIKKVSRGSLFFAFDIDEIDDAIYNGAYGVIFDNKVQITDAEIAWIKVENINQALESLIRFHFIKNEIKAYSCDQISLKLLQNFDFQNSITIFDDSLRNLAKKSFSLQKNDIVIYNPQNINENIFINHQNIKTNILKKVIITEQTLFETSFIFNDIFYERVTLSPFFVPFIENIFNFLHNNKIKFRLKEFKNIKHFEPVFTNNSLAKQEFGSSEKVLIFEKAFEYIPSFIDFLKEQASWAKVIYILNQKYYEELKNYDGVFLYENIINAIHVLQNESFHYALISENEDEVYKLLNTDAKEQLTMDFF